jgi:hypothetical protein
MEQFIERIKKTLVNKNIKSFWVFPDSENFKIIKRTKDIVVNNLKLAPKKYNNVNIANVTLTTREKGISDGDWVFGIKIDVYEVNNGKINQFPNDSWGLTVKYYTDDLQDYVSGNKTFDLKNIIRNMVYLVDEKIILSTFDGITYKEFVERVKKAKKSGKGLHENNSFTSAKGLGYRPPIIGEVINLDSAKLSSKKSILEYLKQF